jgi:hypothetical protein
MIISGSLYGVIASSKPRIVIASGGGTRPRIYIFDIFWDTEMVVNRYDTTSTTVETTARGWFFR